VWFSVVFLGEHYVVDVIGGVVLAAVSWLVMMRVAVPRIRALRPPEPVAVTAAEPAVG
jgi:membrane-associated phospholipid phosphatase